ncbi:MAG: hypothetical protein WC900_04520 [Oscillospiraceae bacterium]|jgi:hypothetical protein
MKQKNKIIEWLMGDRKPLAAFFHWKMQVLLWAIVGVILLISGNLKG